jgi:hypothetical protein
MNRHSTLTEQKQTLWTSRTISASGSLRETESKANAADRLLRRQTLQQISTATSLVSLSLGFLIVGMLIIMNRNQAEVNGLTGGNPVATAGGISAMVNWHRFLCCRLSPLEVLRQILFGVYDRSPVCAS